MGVTRLKRKERRNKHVAAVRQTKIKHLTATPVIKNIDVEKIKEEFAQKAAPAAKSEEKKAPKAKKEASAEESEKE